MLSLIFEQNWIAVKINQKKKCEKISVLFDRSSHRSLKEILASIRWIMNQA